MIEATDDRSGQNHLINHLLDLYHIEKYETGWINRSDWTNVHMGSNTGLNVDSNVTHNLDGNLSELIIKVLISTDGTDDNSLLIGDAEDGGGGSRGIEIRQRSMNAFEIQTGINGILHLSGAGSGLAIDTENWYYKIVVYKVTK